MRKRLTPWKRGGARSFVQLYLCIRSFGLKPWSETRLGYLRFSTEQGNRAYGHLSVPV
jgi:hypothetical protein